MDIPEDFDLEDFEDEEPPEMYEMLGTVKIYLSMCILKILGLLVGIFFISILPGFMLKRLSDIFGWGLWGSF